MKIFKRIDVWFLAGILAIAAIARYWAMNFGLPHTECRPDETTIVFVTMKFFRDGLNPDFFQYPSLYMYIMFIIYSCFYGIGLLTGRFSGLDSFFAEYNSDPSVFYLMDRSVSAFLGVMTVLIVYLIAKQLFQKKVALVSALFLALSYLHVRESHFGVTDVPMLFFAMCSMLFIVKSYYSKASLKNYILAGVFAGLAASTKYNGVLVAGGMIAAHCFNVLEKEKGGWKGLFDRRIMYFFLAVILAFFAGTPFALISCGQFVSEFMYELTHLGQGHGFQMEKGWLYHLRVSLFYGLGGSMLVTGVVGMFFLAKKDVRKWLILFIFPIYYYFIIGKGYTVFVRYALPLVPFFCIMSAFVVVSLEEWIIRKLKLKGVRSVLVLFVVLIIYPSYVNIVNFNALMAKKDNRLIAAEWINKNIPKGSSIYQTGSFPGRVRCIPGYSQWSLDDVTYEFMLDTVRRKDLPEYILLEDSALHHYDPLPVVKSMLQDIYDLKQSFVAVDSKEKAHLYDMQDAFYLPYTGFKRIARPGPNLFVYKLKDIQR